MENLEVSESGTKSKGIQNSLTNEIILKVSHHALEVVYFRKVNMWTILKSQIVLLIGEKKQFALSTASFLSLEVVF